MSSKTFLTEAGWSQQDQRFEYTFYDQHKSAAFPMGRAWWAWCERPAEGAGMAMPVGELAPRGWNAPWLPDSKFIVRTLGRARMGATTTQFHFKIDYPSLIADRRRSMDEYYNKAVTEAIGLGFPVPDFGDPISYKLQQVIGKPPQSPKIPEAAAAEDPWILGFSQVENEPLARLLTLGHEDILTARQSIAKQDTVGDLQKVIAELAAKVAAMETQPAKRGRPRKEPSVSV